MSAYPYENSGGSTYSARQGELSSVDTSAANAAGGQGTTMNVTPGGGSVPSATKDPFMAMISHAEMLNRAAGPQTSSIMQKPPAVAPVRTGGGIAMPTKTTGAPPTSYPMQRMGAAGNLRPEDNRSPETTPGGEAPGTATPGGGNPNTGTGGVNPVKPQNISDTTWQKAVEWGRTPGYEWLTTHPQIIDEYYQFAAQQGQQGHTGIDIVDWIKHAHPELPSPLAGTRNGNRDTWLVDANGQARPWAGMRSHPSGGGGEVPGTATGGSGTTPGTGTTTPGTGTTTPGTDPGAVPPNPANSGASDQAWKQAYSWSQTPGYEWLRERPWAVQQYWDEAARLAQQGEYGIDFVDWAKNRFTDVSSPQAMRGGFDSYIYRDKNGTLRGYGSGIHQAGNPPNPTPTGTTSTPAPPTTTTTTTPTPGGGGTTTTPVVSTPFTPSHEVSTEFPANPNPGGGAAQQAAANGVDVASLLQPAFQSQRNDLQRALNAQGALTGNINSGGFSTTYGNAMARLGADQSSKLADVTAEASKSALDRELQRYLGDQSNATQRYGIDVNKGIQQAAQELQKLGLNLNDTLERYKIDNSDKLQRFLANLQAETAKFTSGQQISAAQMQAAASQAAANAQLQAENARSQLQYQLGTYNADISRERNMADYLLGLYGLGGKSMQNIINTSPDVFLNAIGYPSGTTVVKP